MNVFSKVGSNPKLAKGDNGYYLTLGLSLAPSNLSGMNVCLYATKGCSSSCLNFAGRGRASNTQIARIQRTTKFRQSKYEFFLLMCQDIDSFLRKCDKQGVKPVVRLNVFSDLPWECIYPMLFSKYSDIQFYDYTKDPYRCIEGYKLPSNYHLTFSRSEKNEVWCDKVSTNIAVVFRTNIFPIKYMGRKVVNGDVNDLRFLDPKGVIVGLKAKGRAKHDKTGFVVDTM